MSTTTERNLSSTTLVPDRTTCLLPSGKIRSSGARGLSSQPCSSPPGKNQQRREKGEGEATHGYDRCPQTRNGPVGVLCRFEDDDSVRSGEGGEEGVDEVDGAQAGADDDDVLRA